MNTHAEQDIHAIGWLLAVSDMERSTRFYCEGLGFGVGQTAERGDEAAGTLELDSCKFQLRFLARPDARLMLMQLLEPSPLGDKARKSARELGPLSMSFTCPSPAETAARLAALGGTLVHHGRTASGKADLSLVTDPDGFRVELVSAPIDAVRLMFA